MTCIKDFAPVTQLAASYGLALITNLPVKSVADLVALAKKKPGQLTYATNGVGNVTHVAGLLFEARTGMKMIAVPYNTPNLTTDVMTGQVDMAFYSVAAAAPLVKAGKIKALARHRLAPLAGAAGHADAAGTRLQGFRRHRLFRPAVSGRYAARPDRRDLSRPPRTRCRRRSSSASSTCPAMYPVGSSPEEFAAFLEKDYAYQDKLMSELGLKVK